MTSLGGFQDGICNAIRRQSIAERWRGLFAFADSFQKISELVDEGVLVADLQPRNPPALHIWMIAVGHVDAAPTARPTFIAMIEILNAMQVVQIPKGRSMLAIDFERVERLVTARVSRRFKGRERAVLEAT